MLETRQRQTSSKRWYDSQPPVENQPLWPFREIEKSPWNQHSDSVGSLAGEIVSIVYSHEVASFGDNQQLDEIRLPPPHFVNEKTQ
tara:strand:+ start:129 stop:386 length:258 start_codon:yes stop_codon:yes gene_type:complete